MILEIEDQLNQIHKIRSGEIKEGLSLGIKTFDQHWRFKKGSFNVFLGHSNVGKTHFVLYLMFLYTIKHGLRWLLYCGENEPYSIVKKLMEYKEGLPINKIDEGKLKELSSWVDSHFKIIGNEELYTYKSLIDLGTELKKGWDYHGFFIDPYNSLARDRELYRAVGGHEYDYQVYSEFRMFCHKTKVSLWLTCHAVTESLRRVHPPNHEYGGYPISPRMNDAEGGGKVANKSSNMAVIHRMVQHPMLWMITEMHILKIKNTDTGGLPTTYMNPLKLKSVPNNVGFSFEGNDMREDIEDGHTGEGIQKT